MNRKVLVGSIIAAATLATLSAAYVGGSLWSGYAVEHTLQKQHAWLTDQPYFIVKSRSYERGWFSSTEKTTLAVNPALYRYFLEKEGEKLPEFQLSYVHHIQHGPLPLLGSFNLHPYKAVVTTEFNFSPETRKRVEQFFGKKNPIEIENRISFSDSGIMQIRVPAFDYEEAISGVKAKWLGLQATIEYGGDYNSIRLKSTVPGLTGEAKPKFDFALNNLQMDMDHQRGPAGIMLGQTNAQLGKFNLSLDQNGKPFAVGLDQLAYHGKLDQAGDFLNGAANVTLSKLTLDGKAYGPVEVEAEARHLHGPTLFKLSQELTRLQKSNLPQEQLSEEVIKLAQSQGTPLLAQDPQFAIRKLDVQLPDGKIHFAGEIGLKGFKEEDLHAAPQFISKLNAKADFTVPRKVVETVVRWQFRSQLGGQGRVNEADLDYLAEQMVEGQINRLAEQKLIRIEDDKLAATASLEGGKFTLNGIEIPLPWQQAAAKSK